MARNNDLLKDILQEARDTANDAGDLVRDDEIRCIMVDLALLPRGDCRTPRDHRGETVK